MKYDRGNPYYSLILKNCYKRNDFKENLELLEL